MRRRRKKIFDFVPNVTMRREGISCSVSVERKVMKLAGLTEPATKRRYPKGDYLPEVEPSSKATSNPRYLTRNVLSISPKKGNAYLTILSRGI